MERFRAEPGEGINKLEQLRTDEARSVLLQIALGHSKPAKARSPRYQQAAAHAYVRTLADGSEARQLLSASEPSVCQVGLLKLSGQAIDAELMGHLERLLNSEDLHVRSACATVMREAPDDACGPQKAEALIACLATVPQSPQAGKNARLGPTYAGPARTTPTGLSLRRWWSPRALLPSWSAS